MDQMENQINNILGNPEMMSKIMSLAQSFQTEQPAPSTQEANASSPDLPAGLDLQTLGKLSGLLGKSSIDQHQHALLQAMIPYLSKPRIDKLERAMRAAKMASMASSLFGSGLLFGR